jgi:hypothetical protein
MQHGDRVLDKESHEVGFIEKISEDGKTVSCWIGVGPDRRLSEYPIKDLVKVGPTAQSIVDKDYDPFKLPDDEYDPFKVSVEGHDPLKAPDDGYDPFKDPNDGYKPF